MRFIKITALFTLITFSIIPTKKIYSQAFQEGKHFLSLGYGIGNVGNSMILAVGDESDVFNFAYSSTGPAFLKYECGIGENFGFGINFAYITGVGSFTYTDHSGEEYSSQIDRLGYNINLRFAWHFGKSDIVDPYFALGAGLRHNKLNFKSIGPGYDFDLGVLSNVFPLGVEMAFGSRFMFTKNVGAYVEVGLNRAIFQAGLTAKF